MAIDASTNENEHQLNSRTQQFLNKRLVYADSNKECYSWGFCTTGKQVTFSIGGLVSCERMLNSMRIDYDVSDRQIGINSLATRHTHP